VKGGEGAHPQDGSFPMTPFQGREALRAEAEGGGGRGEGTGRMHITIPTGGKEGPRSPTGPRTGEKVP